MTVRIIGTGSAFPKSVVTNDFLSGIMDTSDEWISSRTGIRSRRLVKEETTAEMAAEAAKRALEDGKTDPSEIDLIIVGTITGDHVTPSTACEVQDRIGADHATAFDIGGACSGFMFSLHTVYAYMQAGLCRKALVIGAESLSRIMDWKDRSTCVLFGDGAGAVVVEAKKQGLFVFDQGTDGAKSGALTCAGRLNNNPLVCQGEKQGYVQMDGQAVYKFAVTAVPASISRVLQEAEVSVEEIKYFLVHQANVRIIQSVAKRLNAAEDKFPLSLEHCGNMSAASVPVLLDEVNKKGLLKRGDKIVLCGFGAGLSWGTALLEW